MDTYQEHVYFHLVECVGNAHVVRASLTRRQQKSSWGLTGRREPTPSGPTLWASLWPTAQSSAGSSATCCTRSCGMDTAMYGTKYPSLTASYSLRHLGDVRRADALSDQRLLQQHELNKKPGEIIKQKYLLV